MATMIDPRTGAVVNVPTPQQLPWDVSEVASIPESQAVTEQVERSNSLYDAGAFIGLILSLTDFLRR